MTDTNVSAGTKAILANITDPYMGRIELVEITPESTASEGDSELEITRAA